MDVYHINMIKINSCTMFLFFYVGEFDLLPFDKNKFMQ